MTPRVIISFLVAVALTTALAGAATLPAPVIQVDASGLADGQITQWATTGGSTTGKFSRTAASTGPINVATVAGRKAVTFDGTAGVQSDFTSPDSITGTNPWTMAVWAYNPAVGDQEVVFATTNANNVSNQTAVWLGWGTNSGNGAVTNIGGDMRYDRGAPSAGQWHLLVVTYTGGAGGWERLWVDAGITVQTTRTLTLRTGDPCRIGFTDRGNRYFSGSIAKIQVFAAELSYDQIVQLYTDGGGVIPATPQVTNSTFEAPPYAGGLGDNLRVLGWSQFSSTQPHRTGVNGHNYNWDNGVNPDGNQVMSVWDGGNTCQFINGFKAGKTYRLIFHANAKTSTSQPGLDVKLNGASLPGWPKTVGAVEAKNSFTQPFTRYQADWTAPSDGGFWLQFAETHSAMAGQASGTTGYAVDIDKVILTDLSQPAKAVLSSSNLNFYAVQKGFSKTLTLRVTNTGGQQLSITGAPSTGTDGALYQTTTSLTFPLTLDPGDTRDIPVTFSPVATGTFNNATLALATNIGTINVPLLGFSPDYPTVVNGSFELPDYAGAGQGDNIAIPGWDGTPAIGIGVGDGNSPHVNNGKLFDGNQALFIQNNPGTTAQIQEVSQWVAGFHAGKKCKVVLYVNARATGDNKAGLRVVMGGQQLTSTTITANGNDNDFNTLYQRLEYDFTPAAEQPYLLEISQQQPVDNSSLLIDKVAVIEYDSPATIGVPATLTIPGAKTYQATASLPIINDGGTPLSVSGVTIVGDTLKFSTVGATAVTVPAYCGTASVTVGYKSQEAGPYPGAVAKINYGTSNVVTNLIGNEVDGPTVVNPSFEDPPQNPSTGNGSTAPVPGWSAQRANAVGVSYSTTYIPASGRPDGVQNLWLRKGDQVNQLIPGFVPGQTYHISLWADAANATQIANTDGKALLLARIGGITLFGGQKEITSNVTTAPYFVKFEQDFTANASAMLLEIIQPTPPDDSELWIDNVQITGGPAPNAVRTWSMFE